MHRRPLLAAVAAGALLLALPGAWPVSAATAPGQPAGPATGIGHVFVIVLENESYSAAFETNPNPYLARTLRSQGTLLRQYYATGHLSNDNYLSMISGQAPNPATQSDCQTYVDFQPSPAVFGPSGQAIGTGCVYPPQVLTLPDQLQAAGRTWHGYMQSMGNDLSREPDRCGAPAASAGTGMPDGTQTATAKDQYAARHNPFVYFHSLIDSGSCERNVVPLPHLAQDLASVATTPNLSYIVPDLCNDGHDAPCKAPDVAGSTAGGLTSVDHFLAQVVPMIQASPAYRQDGLIVVTTDEADPRDATACCGEQPGPNSPLPGITGPGGGRTGTLVLGRCVAAGGTSDQPYNHYSLLRTLEDLAGVTTGGSDGAGHLGFAGATGLASFGPDVFSACPAAGTPAGTGTATPTSAPGGTPPAGSAPLGAGSRLLAATGGLPLAPVALLLLLGALVAGRITRKAGR